MSLPAASPARACASLRAWNAQRYGWPSWRGMRQWRPSTNMNEHKEERSLERLVDMEVLQKERLDLGFFRESRGRRDALLNGKSPLERRLPCQYKFRGCSVGQRSGPEQSPGRASAGCCRACLIQQLLLNSEDIEANIQQCCMIPRFESSDRRARPSKLRSCCAERG